MALVSGNRSAQDRLWRHQPGSRAVGSGLENGTARGQRTEGRASQGRGEDSPSRGWEEEGDGDEFDYGKGSGRVAGDHRGSDEPGQMDGALPGAPRREPVAVRASQQDDAAHRVSPPAR